MKRDSPCLWDITWLIFNWLFSAYITIFNEISRKSKDSIIFG